MHNTGSLSLSSESATGARVLTFAIFSSKSSGLGSQNSIIFVIFIASKNIFKISLMVIIKVEPSLTSDSTLRSLSHAGACQLFFQDL
jgi:hypothetical protein